MRLAIYHLEAKVISRSAGRSAVAAAAYMSCSAILNDYDGIQHDYTRKQGLVWQQVFLPENAPAEWADRAALWNTVEANEKTKDSRLAREFVAALPVELGREEWKSLLTEFIQEQFVSDGMCADVCIHNTDGHNPHAHIMLTVRPLDEHGKWQYKTEKEYLCVRNGEEQGFTSDEFKSAQTEGWEKQYQYKVGRKKVYMAPSTAEVQGYERVSKYPKSTKYGRQNPISQRWNSDEQLVRWRESWAETVNQSLERSGRDERIDHRSHAARGLDDQPTVHEGVSARALERHGIVSDRCELNRQIKADNALLRELKAQVKKLMQALQNTIPALAEAMETLRQNMIILQYQLLHIRNGEGRISEQLKNLRYRLKQYAGLKKQIKETSQERKALLAEKKATSVLQILKQRDLSRRITELTENLEELHSERSMLLDSLDCQDDSGVAEAKKSASTMESMLAKLNQQEQRYTAELNDALKQYSDLKELSEDLDPFVLLEARQVLRPAKECEAVHKLQDAYSDKYSPLTMFDSQHDLDKILGEKQLRQFVRKNLQEKQRNSHQRQKKNREPER
jgi:predicted nuclease with TOPRIM domain